MLLRENVVTRVMVWNRVDGRPFADTTRELDRGVLQFMEATGDESGQYICTAVNSAGTSTATVELRVRGIQLLDGAACLFHRLKKRFNICACARIKFSHVQFGLHK